MKHTGLKLLTALVVFVFVAIGFTAALPGSYAATGSNSGGTFIFGSAVDTSVANLNPLTATNSLASILVKDMYATQLAYQWPSGNFSAWLASSWSTANNPNGTETITFHLNPNAEWVNGTTPAGQITTQDVLFTFQALAKNQTLDFNGITPAIESMSASNNTTITFLMKSQNILWFQYIATQIIIPKAWSAYDGGNPGNIGSYTNMGPYGKELTAGPFVLTSINVAGAELKPNPHFWMGVPHIGTYYVEKYTSTATADLALEKGSISAVNPALSDYNALIGQNNITNVKEQAPYVFYLWMNDHVAPFNNTNFRIGMSYALNKTYIMSKDEDGIGAAGSQNMSFGGLPGIMKYAWASNLTYYNYNVTMAKHYFEKAGYHIPSGQSYFVNNTTGARVQFLVQEPSSVADWVASGTTIASELQAAGIYAQIDVIPIGTWVTEDLNLSNFIQTTYFGYVPSVTNPYIQLQQAYEGYHNSTGVFVGGPWNYENFSNSTVNHYLNLSKNATSLTQLEQNLSVVQKVIDKLVPMIPMSNAFNYVAYNNARVTGEVKNLSIDDPYNLLQLTVVSSPQFNSTASGGLGNTLYYIAGGIVAVVIIASVVGIMMRGKKGGKEEK